MIARWEKGRAQVDRLLSENRLQQVRASRPLAEQMLEQAEAHVASATQLVGSDPAGAFQLAYDAARKSLAAVLANQGLRAKGAGAHATLYEATRAQLHPPLGPILDPFDWMRRLRNSTEYPDLDSPVAGLDDVKESHTGGSQDHRPGPHSPRPDAGVLTPRRAASLPGGGEFVACPAWAIGRPPGSRLGSAMLGAGHGESSIGLVSLGAGPSCSTISAVRGFTFSSFSM